MRRKPELTAPAWVNRKTNAVAVSAIIAQASVAATIWRDVGLIEIVYSECSFVVSGNAAPPANSCPAALSLDESRGPQVEAAAIF